MREEEAPEDECRCHVAAQYGAAWQTAWPQGAEFAVRQTKLLLALVKAARMAAAGLVRATARARVQFDRLPELTLEPETAQVTATAELVRPVQLLQAAAMQVQPTPPAEAVELLRPAALVQAGTLEVLPDRRFEKVARRRVPEPVWPAQAWMV